MIACRKRRPALAATLGAYLMLAIGGAQTSWAASNDGGPFSRTQWGDRHSVSTTYAYVPPPGARRAKNGSTTANNPRARAPGWNAYNSYGIAPGAYDSRRTTSRPSQSWDPYGLRWDGGN